MDEAATNYNADANVNSGCTYDPVNLPIDFESAVELLALTEEQEL